MLRDTLEKRDFDENAFILAKAAKIVKNYIFSLIFGLNVVHSNLI